VRSFAVYTAGRLLVFVTTAAVLYLLGLRGFPLVLMALLLSLPLSYLLLARARAAFVADVERRVAERRARREDLRSRLRGDEPEA
jgi:predicted permease